MLDLLNCTSPMGMPAKPVSDDARHVHSHLMDCDLLGFTDIKADGMPSPLGDIAFDEQQQG